MNDMDETPAPKPLADKSEASSAKIAATPPLSPSRVESERRALVQLVEINEAGDGLRTRDENLIAEYERLARLGYAIRYNERILDLDGYWITQAGKARLKFLLAQGTEARSGETPLRRLDPKDESAVGEADAPVPKPKSDGGS